MTTSFRNSMWIAALAVVLTMALPFGCESAAVSEGPAQEDTAGQPTDDTGSETADSPIDDVQTELPAVETAASEKARETSPELQSGDLEQLIAGNSAFAFDMYQSIRSEEGNLFYSPHSISIALAMTFGGSRGDTAAQMADAMNFTLPQDRLHAAFNWLDLELARRNELPEYEEGEGFILRVANATWGQSGYPFLSEYLDLIAENYGAAMNIMDFAANAEAARQTINDWVAAQTEDKILDLIPPGAIDSLTRLVLTNAIYFFAPWEYPFEVEMTRDASFNRLDESTVTVPMMRQTEGFGYVDGEGFTAVDLPYNGRTLSMVLLLPDIGSFEAFESGLDAARVAEIIAAMGHDRLDLSLPRFEFETSFGLNQVLAQLGMTDAFSHGAADFSGMDGSRDLFITAVIHKAFVAVDEEGTEAAAATAVVVGTTSVPPPPTVVTFDRPFIFLIRDIQTGAILFVGRVVDPSA